MSRRLQKKSKTIEDVAALERFVRQRLDPLVLVIRGNIQTMSDYHAILEGLFI